MSKLLFCDNAGFSTYTYKLCNAAYECDKSDEIIYLTDQMNDNIKLVNKGINTVNKIAAYNPKYKRGSIKWFFNRLFLPFRIIASRNKYMKSLKADVAYMQAPIPIFDQFLIKKLKKYSKIILTVHNVFPHEKTVFWSDKSLNRLYHNADHLIVHTNENKKELMEIFGIEDSKITIINIGTDIDYNHLDYNECRKDVGIYDEKPALLVYGGIRDYKGIDTLIPALEGLDCHLIIAGALQNGITFDTYQKLIDKYNVDTKSFIERVSDEFTDVLFQACDYVAFPYKEFHSQSGVFMQAIKYGKKVIATDVGAFKEFVDIYRIGYICKPNDINDMHNCIEKALSDFNENSGKTDNIAYMFSWEASAKQYIEVFHGTNSNN